MSKEELDCGDNSCHFAKNKTGMRTNGGCRCLERAGVRSRSLVAGAIELLPKYLSAEQRIRQLEEKLAKAEDAIERTLRADGSLHKPIYFLWLREALAFIREGEKK